MSKRLFSLYFVCACVPDLEWPSANLALLTGIFSLCDLVSNMMAVLQQKPVHIMMYNNGCHFSIFAQLTILPLLLIFMAVLFPTEIANENGYEAPGWMMACLFKCFILSNLIDLVKFRFLLKERHQNVLVSK